MPNPLEQSCPQYWLLMKSLSKQCPWFHGGHHVFIKGNVSSHEWCDVKVKREDVLIIAPLTKAKDLDHAMWWEAPVLTIQGKKSSTEKRKTKWINIILLRYYIVDPYNLERIFINFFSCSKNFELTNDSSEISSYRI